MFSRRQFDNNKFQLLILFLLICFSGWKSLSSFNKINKLDDHNFFEDFYLQYDSSANHKLYFSDQAPDFRPYPPTTSLFYKIFTYLPYRNAAALFQLFNFLSVIFIILFCFYFLTPKKLNNLNFIVFVALIFFPLLESLYLGQLNCIILALVLLILFCELKLKNKYKNCVIGFLIAAGCSLKLFPAVLLFYYLIKKNITAILYFLLFTIIIIVFSIGVFGIDSFIFYYKKIIPYTPVSWVMLSIENQSLTGLFSRLFGNTFQRGFTGIIYFPQLIKPAYFICAGLITIFTFFILRKSNNIIHQFMILIIFGLLIFGLNWAHTFVLAFPAMIYLFYKIINNKNIIIVFLPILAIAFILLRNYYDFRTMKITGFEHLITMPNYFGALILFILLIKVNSNEK